jgi:hypothetical protein
MWWCWGRHNHDQFLKDFDMAVVAYTTAWCEHCKELESQCTQNAALYFKDHHVRVPLARIDCTRNEEFCSEHLIPSYPYIKLYIRKYPISYYGPRTSQGHSILPQKDTQKDSLASVCLRRYDCDARTSEQANEPEHFSCSSDSETAKIIFTSIWPANSAVTYKCLFSDDPYIRNQFSLEEDDRVVLWKKNNRKISRQTTNKNFDKFEEFLFHKRYPGLKPLGEDFKSKVVRGGRNALILFTETAKHQSVREFEAGYQTVQKKHLLQLRIFGRTGQPTYS